MDLSWQVARAGDVLAQTTDPGGWLTAAERSRAQRLVRTVDRDAFVAAHVLVRQTAGAVLSVEPRDLEIVQHCDVCGGPHGRPRVAGAAALHVSLSHSRGWVAACAAPVPCGIDVEDLATSGDRTVPRRALSASESAWVDAAADPWRAFASLWVRKEAMVKAGALTIDELATVSLVGPGADAVATHAPGVSLAEVADETPGVVGAVALRAPGPARSA